MVTRRTPADETLLDEMKRKRLLQSASDLERPLERLASGVPGLDRVAEGGLPRGRISEVCTGPAGGASVLYAVLGAFSRRGELVGLVDGDDGFDAFSARAARVDLARLLWVRPPDLNEALRAAELVLDSGGFGLVILDLGRRTDTAPAAGWLRLDRVVRQREAILLVLSPRGLVGPFAALAVDIQQRRARWGRDGAGDDFVAGLEPAFSLRRMRCG